MSKTEQTQELDPRVKNVILDQNLNISQKIRQLHALKMSRGDIARILNKRYQHVRNVLITPIKKAQ